MWKRSWPVTHIPLHRSCSSHGLPPPSNVTHGGGERVGEANHPGPSSAADARPSSSRRPAQCHLRWSRRNRQTLSQKNSTSSSQALRLCFRLRKHHLRRGQLVNKYRDLRSLGQFQSLLNAHRVARTQPQPDRRTTTASCSKEAWWSTVSARKRGAVSEFSTVGHAPFGKPSYHEDLIGAQHVEKKPCSVNSTSHQTRTTRTFFA